MGALYEAAATEAASRNVCVYHDNGGTDVIVSNNVYPTLADVDDTGSDAAKWDAINAAWRKIETVAGVVGVAVEEVGSEGGAPPCSRIRIPVDLASEDLKQACTNGYPRPKRPSPSASDDEGETPPAKRPASEASEASDKTAVTITSRTVNPDTGHIDYEWAPLKAPGAYRAWAEECLTCWTPKELLDLATEWKHGRLGDRDSIPHHLAADYLSTRNPQFDDLCALFTDVCTAIATYNAANPI